MALITCAECKREISDLAPACPGCGAPQAKTAAAQHPPTTKNSKTSPIAWVALIAIIFGVIWYFRSPAFQQSILPAMPVEVGFRNALMGPGMVLVVKNDSDRQLSIMATLDNPTTKQEKSFRMDIAPHGKTELGHMEGWVLSSGDTIKLMQNDYQTWNGSIP